MGQKRKLHLSWPILLIGLVFARQELAQTPADKLLEVESIRVNGTRLPSDSVIRLSGIKVHDKVNDRIVNAACHKITATGLVKTVDYAYDAYPDRPGVVLNLTLSDEGPLLPSSIKPDGEENTLWSSLQALDPIFTRELPPTEKALAFYSKNLERCLQTNGRPNEYAGASVTADSSGNLIGIVFEIRQYKTLTPHK
jgi:hypothetical protein